MKKNSDRQDRGPASETHTTQQKDFLKVLGLASDMNPYDGGNEEAKEEPEEEGDRGSNNSRNGNRNSGNKDNAGNRAKAKCKVKGNIGREVPQPSGWRCINIPMSLYRRVRALGYYLTLSGDGSTVSMAQAIDTAIEAYAEDNPDAGKFLERYRDGRG